MWLVGLHCTCTPGSESPRISMLPRDNSVSSHQRVAQIAGARAPVRVDNTLMTSSFTRTLRFKVRPESYGWLSAAAVEVNQVFNFWLRHGNAARSSDGTPG